MKKKIFVIVLALASVFCLACCDGKLGKYGKSVSEYRDNVLVGKSANFTADAVSGYREDPFTIDGVSGSKTDFLVVTVKPNAFDPTRDYKYSVVVDGKEYTGGFVKHPFEDTYSFEIKARFTGDTLAVSVDGETIELKTVRTENYITPEKAFEIALKRLEKSEVIEKGKYEIYIRLIENPVSAAGGYFWYVAFVDEEGETVAVLIEPETMEITAVRE